MKSCPTQNGREALMLSEIIKAQKDRYHFLFSYEKHKRKNIDLNID